MKIIKKIAIFLVVFIAIIYIAALLAPKNFDTRKSIVIHKPVQDVFNYIKYVKNQDYYGVWQLSDPMMKKSYTGNDGEVGFVYSWDGEKVGKGSQKITEIVDGKAFRTELDFGFGEPAQCFFYTQAIDSNTTNVTWGISGTSPIPFNLMSLIFDVGKDFEQGLTNLKKIQENK